MNDSDTEQPKGDFVTQLVMPDNRACFVMGVHDHAEAVKRLRADLEQQVAEAQAILALTDDQFTISHHEAW